MSFAKVDDGPKTGLFKNRDLLRDTLIGPAAANANIHAGDLVYYNNGWRQTSATPQDLGKVRVAENAVDNTGGGAKGDKLVSSFGGGAIVTVTVGSLDKSGADQAFAAGDVFINAAGGTIVPPSVPTTTPATTKYLGVVLGRADEVEETNKDSANTALAEGNVVQVRFF